MNSFISGNTINVLAEKRVAQNAVISYMPYVLAAVLIMAACFICNAIVQKILKKNGHTAYALLCKCAIYILGGRNTNDLFLGNYKEDHNEDRDILVAERYGDRGRELSADSPECF